MGMLSGLKNLFSSRGRAVSLYERGMRKAKARDYAGAINDYGQVLRIDKAPEDVKAMALFNRGLALSMNKEDDKALVDLNQVVSMKGAPSYVVSAAREKLERMRKRSSRGE